MYNKELIIAIENKLCCQANIAPRIAVQDMFIRSVSARILEKAITIVIPISLKSSTSLLTRLSNDHINIERIKMLNLELESNAFSKISPLFQAVFIDEPTVSMKQFAKWLKASNISQTNTIEIFGEPAHIAECFDISKKKLCLFHGKWFYGILTLNAMQPSSRYQSNKFIDESELGDSDAIYS